MFTGNAFSLKEYLKHNKIITDGAFGTYYSKLYDTGEIPEAANDEFPQRVSDIHMQYIKAGAKLIRTNTFAANTISLNKDIVAVRANIANAVNIAKNAVADREVYIAADIGPIPNDSMFDRDVISNEYIEICRVFLEQGIDIFVFETFSDMDEISAAVDYIGNRGFVIVQFAINQFGYSNSGLSARRLIEEADKHEHVDALGFNCGIGPGHMNKVVSNVISKSGKFFTAIPNAGYPQAVSSRMVFSDRNTGYFAEKIADIAKLGADIVGGCCGTTPEYIKRLSMLVNTDNSGNKHIISCDGSKETKTVNNAFYNGKGNKKLIAVELAPPLGTDAEKLMDAAFMLKNSGVDVLTFPDSPSGRTRADSILMAEKVARETKMCVMPHICCRDKNAIAMRSQLLGAHINDISNFLVVTGDPIPSMVRSTIKSVFNFDSIGLMNILSDMNEEQFADSPVVYGGAVNQGRLNFEIELERIKKKIKAGATFFLTQPVFSDEDIERLRVIKEETGTIILCGIMPFVSLRNAMFMKNEMTGINVTDEILSRYREDMTKEEGENAGVEIAREIIIKTKDFVDGYYFSFPFNRVHMLTSIKNVID